MEKYSSYRKTEEIYFNWNEYIIAPALALLVVSIITYISLYFFGTIFTVFLILIGAGIINSLWLGLKSFSPNGNSRSRPKVPSFIALLSFLRTYVIVLFILVIANIGAYVLLVYQKENILYAGLFYFWLAIVFGLPIAYFVSREIIASRKQYAQALRYTKVHFKIKYDPEFLLQIDEIAFLNTLKKRGAWLSLHQKEKNDSSVPLASLDITARNEILFSPRYHESIFIPINTNQFKVAYFSVIENVYYEDIITFPYEKLHFEENKYPTDEPQILRGNKTDTITIYFFKNGKIKLYSGQKLLLEHSLHVSQTITEEEKNIAKEVYIEKNGLNKITLQPELKAIIEKRTKLNETFFSWDLTVATPQKHLIETNYYNADSEDIKIIADEVTTTRIESTLPHSLVCYCYANGIRKWTTIEIDTAVLYALLLSKKATTFELNLSLDVVKATIQLNLNINNQPSDFNAWENNNVEHNLLEITTKLKEQEENKRKETLYTCIYEHMQKKEYAIAEEKCKQAIKENPSDGILYFYEARIVFYRYGKEACYDKEAYYIEKTKDDRYGLSRIYNNYGCLLDDDKEYEKALPYFEKAADICPEDVMYTANIAEIHYKLKNVKKAIYFANETQKKGYISEMMTTIIKNKGKI
ncbi:hypothetical protein [Flavobacterium sp.]|uniref:hypothetical protein n=1 Tax=Flavobacterium sp. TaxID=239 RepID=UPI00404847BE